jgi:23S rRNA (uridine2552-2'-O)-methyltransferase
MKKSKSSQNWLARQKKINFDKQAKDLGYRSRAAFKLLEIQQQDKIFKPGFAVVDIGAAPGGWSQVASKSVGPHGYVLAVDILPIEKLPGVDIVTGDFSSDEVHQELCTKLAAKNFSKVNVVISDIAPNISGIRSVDQMSTIHLVELALEFALLVLQDGGSFVTKIFQGEGFDAYLKLVRQHFGSVAIRKPKSSRSESKEVYIVAKVAKSRE